MKPTAPAAAVAATPCRRAFPEQSADVCRETLDNAFEARVRDLRVEEAAHPITTGPIAHVGRSLALWLLLVALEGPAFAGPEAASCGSQGIAVQVLGSGGPEVQDRRASSSYLVWQEGRAKVLIDIGGGSALRFGESGATVSSLDVVLLTHLHVDHTADLPALVKSSIFEERDRELPLYGPVGNQAFPSTTEFIRLLFDGRRGAYRYLGTFVDPAVHDPYFLHAHDLRLAESEIREIYAQGGIHVLATRVIHGDVPAVAFRVELGGLSAAFSGDTNGDNGNLERLARNADLLIAHNAVPEGATGVERALHMPPSVIGRIAKAANVRRLVLSHRMLRTLGREAETERIIREVYRGPVSFAEDLSCYPLP
jgi:ribonuclease BN (tRNA processing enzyme)